MKFLSLSALSPCLTHRFLFGNLSFIKRGGEGGADSDSDSDSESDRASYIGARS